VLELDCMLLPYERFAGRYSVRKLSCQRARETRPQKRGKNVSMIKAIALKGIVASINLLGARGGLTFASFCYLTPCTSSLARGLCALG
jgi:hypothetical protein